MLVGLGFVDLTDNDDNGYFCFNYSGCKFLVSTKVPIHAVGTTLGRTNLDFRRVVKIFIARSRTSRVGSLKALNRGCGVPVCTAHTARVNVGGGCYVARGLMSYVHCVRGRSALRFHSFHVAPFRIPRSDDSGMNCLVRFRRGIFYLVASVKRVASAMSSCVTQTRCLIVRTGCSRRVLTRKPCPRCLGRHVTKPDKRLDGGATTLFLTGGVARRLGCV